MAAGGDVHGAAVPDPDHRITGSSGFTLADTIFAGGIVLCCVGLVQLVYRAYCRHRQAQASSLQTPLVEMSSSRGDYISVLDGLEVGMSAVNGGGFTVGS